MNELQNFDFHGTNIRTILIENDPFFVGKDVADVLGYSETNAMTKRLDNEDFMSTKLAGMNMKSTIINESGLYAAIIGSKLPSAKKFKRWVTSEVLPTIRKHGAYLTDQKIEEVLTDPDTIIKLATQLKEERTGRLIAEQQVQEMKPKATYYDRILSNKALVAISVIAKDYGMSGTAMNNLLHRLGVQYKQGKTWLLYSKYQTTGWTQSETTMVKRKDGTEKAVLNTKWTQKGRLGLYELLKLHNYLPLIEQDLDIQEAE